MERAAFVARGRLGLGAVLAALACDAAPEPAEPVAAADLCARLAAEVCAADLACCGGGAGAAGGSACLDAQRSACEVAVGRDARDPRLGYDPSAGGALVAAVRAAGGQCGAVAPPAAELVALFAGTGSAGASCTPSDSTATSLQTAALSCARGAACRLYLRADGTPSGVCEARTDDACSHPADCTAGRFCDVPASWRPGSWGRCVPVRADGWGCTADLQCASRRCSEAGVCVPRTAGSLCLAQSYPATVLASAPSASLRLGESLRSAAADQSGHGAAGAYAGPTTHSLAGALASDDDGAVHLDGAGGRVTLPALADLADGGPFSVECWARADAAATAQPVLEFAAAAGSGVNVATAAPGTALAADFVDRGGASHRLASEAATFDARRWHHVVLTFDGAAARLFVDGAAAGMTAVSTAMRTGGELRVGYRPASGMTAAASFAGQFDELAVYPRALSAASVRAHWIAGREGRVAQPYPLFRWLP